jgi:penicillin-binding protein 1C
MYASLARSYQHASIHGGKIMSSEFFSPSYVRENRAPQKNPVALPLDQTSLWFMFQAMEDVMRPGEEGLWQRFSSSRRIAWKTGTSFGFRDAWAVGVTPRYVVVVWAGNAGGEGRPGLIGVQAAAPLMFDIFRMLPDGPGFSEPSSNLTLSVVCRESGYRASLDCLHRDTLRVPMAGIRSPVCPYHKLLHLDQKGRQVDKDCQDSGNMHDSAWFVLPPSMEWYYRQRHIEYADPPAYAEGCGWNNGSRRMDLIYPQYEAHIRVPVEIDGRKGRVVFRAAHRDLGTKIFWHLDDVYIATTTRFHELSVDPPPGHHYITLVDEHGERLTRPFVVDGQEK